MADAESPVAAESSGQVIEMPELAESLMPVSPEIETALSTFLNALRTGDRNVAESLLSDRTRAETARLQIHIEPTLSPQAQFELVGMEAEGELTFVKTNVTEADENGAPFQTTMAWGLRQQADGWRVCGLGFVDEEAEQAAYVNFENGNDLNSWLGQDDGGTVMTGADAAPAPPSDSSAAPGTQADANVTSNPLR